eukprot:1142709-Prymnesium_polylepis.1
MSAHKPRPESSRGQPARAHMRRVCRSVSHPGLRVLSLGARHGVVGCMAGTEPPNCMLIMVGDCAYCYRTAIVHGKAKGTR